MSTDIGVLARAVIHGDYGNGAEQAPPGEPLRRRAGTRERDPVVTREDVVWSVATALAVLLCLGMLPFLPLLWLIERLDS
ncbi:hypothetical protein [Ellagibacter isourolithinifaciens]|uniref:hypothetical protein n=1 Tax=Ellagibacter isourolithinifaciens TaxID=2137581 RepID=UPI003A921B2F